VYLDGALNRALRLEAQPSVVAELAPAEYELLEEASLHDAQADAERALAADARAEADLLHEAQLRD
jgi:hypothetical protein